MGKTSALLQLAWQVEAPALIISAEMSRQAVGERLIAHVAGTSMRKIKAKRTTAAEKLKAKDAVERIRERELYITDSFHITPEVIAKETKYLMDKLGTTDLCVFVDYLQLLSIPDFYGSDEGKVAQISRELKEMNLDTGCRLVIASQLNRGNEQRENKSPRMADLRGSGAIEQDADVIVLLHRPSYYRITDEDPDADDDGTAFWNVAKNRNGPVGKLDYHWNKRTMTFTEKSSRYKEFGE
jgi:replicative DNA helicase